MLARGFQQLEALPEGFLERMRRDLVAGDIIGDRYKIIACIGGGAMGKVYLAENLAIGLKVAVKLLKPELLANSDFRMRFRQEAEAVAAIQHQNVSRFLDLVVDDPTFLVMEYVAGPTLSEEIRKHGALTERRAADIAVRLCWGLHAAHRAGVIHRDLKPSNILLSPDEELGEIPKIIDFGLAKLAAAAEKGTQLTRVGQIIGTPQYMAPEQIGRKTEIDARADLYAAGCVLYAMLVGRPPFVDDDNDAEVLYRQVHEPPTPVRERAPQVSPVLEAVVMRALEKDPARRFASGREMAQALVPTIEKRRRDDGGDIRTDVVKRYDPRAARRWWWIAGAAAIAGGAALGLIVGHRARPTGQLIVASDPAEAEISLDGKPRRERTPAALRDLVPGQHRVQIRRAHHADAERYVKIEPNQTALVEVQLDPQSHALEVQTIPAGATVYLDGALVQGQTPLTLEVRDDEYHRVRVEKAGYVTWQQRIKPEDTAPLPTVTLAKETLPRATLFVDAAGPFEVWIDGQDSGFLTPTPGLRVAAGRHVVELRNFGTPGLQTQLTLAAGDTRRIVLALPK